MTDRKKPRVNRKRQIIIDRLMASDGPVPMAALIAAVYGTNPPPAAAGSIRNAISMLRSDGVLIDLTLKRGYTIIRGSNDHGLCTRDA